MDPLDIENEIHERVMRLTAKINKLAAENIRLTDENKAFKLGWNAKCKRIEKLETFLINLKDCASAEDITLIEQVLEGETP